MGGEEKTFDVIIVGGGPAGMAAAIWAADLGLAAIVIESAVEAGGNLLNIHNPITNYPGIIAANGRELSDTFLRHTERCNVLIRCATPVIKIDTAGWVELSTGNKLQGRHILLATGVRRRTLGIEGENRLRGFLDSGARNPEAVRGMNVAVVGGGDAAAENAAILAPFANRVYLVHRGESLSARHDLARNALGMPNVVFLNNRSVIELHGADTLESIAVAGADGTAIDIPVERAIFRIGVVPNSELLADVVERDSRGYIVTDSCGRTNCETIFAVGDVACPGSPTIVTAAGQAAAAVKAIRSRLS
jgi:thioredoxin reductase (NADPH)